MRDYIKKILKEVFNEVIEEKVGRIAKIATENAYNGLFSYIGVERMKKIIEDIEKRPKGYNGYTSLAEMFSYIMRENLERSQQDIRHHMFEIYPELNKLNKEIEKIDNKK